MNRRSLRVASVVASVCAALAVPASPAQNEEDPANAPSSAAEGQSRKELLRERLRQEMKRLDGEERSRTEERPGKPAPSSEGSQEAAGPAGPEEVEPSSPAQTGDESAPTPSEEGTVSPVEELAPAIPDGSEAGPEPAAQAEGDPQLGGEAETPRLREELPDPMAVLPVDPIFDPVIGFDEELIDRVAQPAAPPAPVPPGSGEESAQSRPQPQQEQEMIQALNFPNLPFDQALDFYADLTGRIILRREQIGNAPETVRMVSNQPLTKQEAIKAFNTVFAMEGIAVIPVGEKFLKVVAADRAKHEGADFSGAQPEELNEMGQFMTRVVQLEYAPVDEAAEVLNQFASNQATDPVVAIESTQTLILRDNEPNVKRMLEMLEQIDVEVPMDVELEVIPIKYALADDVAQVLGTLTPGGAVSSGGSRSSSFRDQSRNRQRRFRRGGDQRQGQQQQQETGTRGNFQSRLQQIVSRAAQGDFELLGETKIIPDARTNQLLVFAGSEDIKMIKKVIEKLDVVQSQVLIEAVIMEVSIEDSRDIGFSYFQRGRAGEFRGAGAVNNNLPFIDIEEFNPSGENGVASLPSGFNYFGRLNDDLEIVVNAIATDDRATVLQRPRIQTSHAVPAHLFVGETRPFVTGTFFGSFGRGNQSSQVQRESIGVSLDVLPLINPEGLVVMEISQTIEDIGGTVNIDGNPVPITTSREADASVAVQDGQTIILGGMISDSESDSESGVPFLKDIPVLGHLFRSTSKGSQRRELIVLLRPTVLETPQIAQETADSELEKLPAVRDAKRRVEQDYKNRRERFRSRYEDDLREEEGATQFDRTRPRGRN